LHRLVLVGSGECLLVAALECLARREWEAGERVVVVRAPAPGVRIPEVVARPLEKD
jgi:hypothetical protein